MPDTHAVLSASGAHRWLKCPPSARINHDAPRRDTAASAEGTRAHTLAEQLLRATLAGEKHQPNNKYPQEMRAHTTDYARFVLEQRNTQIDNTRVGVEDIQILVEQRLDYSKYAPEGFGTADCIIVSDNALHIIDLKYGQGVLVEAEDNPQLKLYALGAIEAFEQVYSFDTVKTTIYQPRRGNIATAEYTVAELKAWGEQIKPTARLAYTGGGEMRPGGWCQFCAIAGSCKTRAEQLMAEAKTVFKPEPPEPRELTEAETAKLLAEFPAIKAWITEVEAYALASAEAGRQYPGWKLVASRSIRKYTDEQAVAEAVAGIDGAVIAKPLGLSAMEKLLGKNQFAELLGDLVIKPAGKPALVPETDKRPALETFTPITSENE